ncbi:MAG: Holliday junction branch migration protein RuvA [Clostridiales bacterium]|nr:Holliday junction branch migration protein RuvA [Clostridiales bacterium]
MYYYLRGELALAEAHTAVVDCGGVGYKLTVSANTLANISPKLGKEVKLYTYLAVREDAMELFGFASESEHSAFKQLISVSGVGPKVAVSILSTLTPEQFAAAVCSGDAKTLAKSKGLGAKGAERIILELKEKLTKEYGASALTAAPVGIQTSGRISDAVNALLVLGYTKQEATEALKGIDSNSMTLEAMITAALRRLMK